MSSSSRKMLQAAAGNAGGADFYPYEIQYALRVTSGAELAWTPSSGRTNDYKATMSCWFKKCKPVINTATEYPIILYANYNGNTEESAWGRVNPGEAPYDCISVLEYYYSNNYSWHKTNAVFRDPSAWYHCVIIVDQTQAQANRLKIYINGVLQSYSRHSADDAGTGMWNVGLQAVNRQSTEQNPCNARGSAAQTDMYFADFIMIDGTAYDISYFGEFKNNVWIPKDPRTQGFSYGNNGYFLDFSNSSAFGEDQSGNNNDFTATGFSSDDQVTDTPTNNYCTLSPIDRLTNTTLSNGNLVAATGGSNSAYWSSMGMVPGRKYQFEVTKNSGDMAMMFSATHYGLDVSNTQTDNLSAFIYYSQGGTSQNRYYYNGSTYAAFPTGFGDDTNGTIYVVLVNLVDNEITIRRNNDATTEATTSLPSAMEGKNIFVGYSITTTWPAGNWTWNFGQTALTYALETDYVHISANNLPEPTIGPNSATTSDENFNTVLYTGTGSARTVTGVGFQPDWLWIKKRSAAENHALYDVVRGPTKRLESNTINAEDTESNGVSSFDSDGFSIQGASDRSNTSGATYVAWNWKISNSGVANTDGTKNSTVYANPDTGMSIVTYVGSGASGAGTVGHGLGAIPDVILVKQYNPGFREADNVYYSSNVSYFKSIGRNGGLVLNSTDAAFSSTNYWGTSDPTSTVFGVGSGAYIGNNKQNYNNIPTVGADHIAYCFTGVEGFSKFGSYTGNGSADGPFVYTGFRPAFVMVKRTNAAENWAIIDDARDPYNLATKFLRPDETSADTTGAADMDLLSNGFKLRNTDPKSNASGSTYIYMAFAENPFKYANAR